MYDIRLENQLIVIDVVDVMQDYVSLQPDIDEGKVKASMILAQKIDLKRILTKENIERCKDPQTEDDETLRGLIIPSLCHFTYSRLLKGFQGVFTDGGYSTDQEAESMKVSAAVALSSYTTGEALLEGALEFLESDKSGPQPDRTKMTPSIRVFGGEERRGNN